MNLTKRLLCLLLAVCLCAGMLAGCASKKTTADVELLAYKCAETDMKLNDYADSFSGFTLVGDRVYALGWKYTDTGSEVVLISVKLDGTDPVQLPLTLHGENNETQGAYIQTLMAGADGSLYTLETITLYGTEENDYAYTETYYLNQLDPATGAELSSTPLTLPENTSIYGYNKPITDAQGNFYLVIDTGVLMLSPAGEVRVLPVFENSTAGSMSSLFQKEDGTIVAGYYDGEKWELHFAPLDLTSGKLGDELTLPEGMENANATIITDPKGKMYYYNDQGIFSLDLTAGTTKQLCSWLDSDIDYNATASNGIYALEDGSFLAFGSGENYDQFLVSTLTYVDPSTLPEKTVMTLGCLYSYNLQKAVLNFNRNSDTVRIKLVDYSSYNNESNEWTGAATQLNTDIVSGKVPDILLVDSSLPYQSYIEKGLFTDLYPLLDADESLKREDFVPNILAACETDGKLNTIIPYYDIMTVVGSANVVGTEPGWTMEEFTTLLAAHPEVQNAFSYTNRQGLLNYAMMLNGSQFVDYATGKCSFDSPEFIQLLEYAATYPEEVNYDDYIDEKTMISQGKILLSMSSLYDFSSIRDYVYNYDGPVTFKGFPASEGNTGSTIMPYMQLAIAESCPEKDAAWQFIRYFLTQDYQTNQIYGDLPLRVDALQAAADRAMNPDSNSGVAYATSSVIGGGDVVVREDAAEATADETTEETTEETADETPTTEEGAETEAVPEEGMGEDPSSQDYWNRPVTQAEIDQMMQLIHSTTSLYHYDQSLMNIVTEEAASFFSGSKTSAEVASIIQNRAQTYLSESR